jgi:hypothetical protein
LYIQTGSEFVFGYERIEEINKEDFLLYHTCSVLVRSPCLGRASRMPPLDLTWVALPDNVRKSSLRLTVSRPFDQGQQRGNLPQVPMQPVLDAQAEEPDAPPGEPRTWDDFLDEDFPDLDDLDAPVITTPVQNTTFFTQLDDDQWDAIAIDENVSKAILAPVPVVPVQDTLIPDPEKITSQP